MPCKAAQTWAKPLSPKACTVSPCSRAVCTETDTGVWRKIGSTSICLSLGMLMMSPSRFMRLIKPERFWRFTIR